MEKEFEMSATELVDLSLNSALYDFLRDLPVLPPSRGNSDANF